VETLGLLFPTTLVGSFPQPEWLIDRARLAGRFSAARASD
jgi:methionine synthase II (cobalamin-independent)